ncbi:LAMI_0H18712g1_1 [Lachancea mirantina]|uniref:LAMI_0H18712g1_1 n=1 Tax=Lachancea mirantina TaxID=1230905 RepID=A0A1G4KJL7_9SACH|nr:LAMI_0H18712g1_1 [Lachancea mirantina]
MSYNNRSRVPCKYFQQGKCNKGNSCKFAHVYTNANGDTNNLSNGERYRSFINANSLVKLSQEIKDDIDAAPSMQSRPLMSSYSLANPCSSNLISGRDLSPEECRFQYMKACQENQLPAYEAQMRARDADLRMCLDVIKKDPRKAARYLQLATQKKKETGNSGMKDFIEQPLDLTGAAYKNTVSTFGMNPINQNAFASNILQSSPFGTQSNSAFTAPSTSNQMFGSSGFASSGTSAPSASISNTGSAFGHPQFGASPFGTGFRQAASNSGVPQTFTNSAFAGSTGAFGKPSFGAGSSTAISPFASVGSTANGISTNSPFGQSNFSKGDNPSPFGAVTRPADKSNASTLFGSSPFSGLGLKAETNTETFGTSTQPLSSPFTQKPNARSPFGTLDSFGAQATTQTDGSTNVPSPFSTASAPAQNVTLGWPTNGQATSGFAGSQTTNAIETLNQGISLKMLEERDLPPEVIAEFRNQRFILGKVPDVPPPQTLIT